MRCLGVDVGGANLKLSDGGEFVQTEAFALWKSPGMLAEKLRTLIGSAGGYDQLAVTMTGELADCFATKAEGVTFIVRASAAAAGDRPLQIYRTDGSFVGLEQAIAEPILAAASNWHALAAFAGRLVPARPAMLLDIGSTTCDLIPLREGIPVPRGATDTDRLLAGELVYTGVERSPVCAVVREVPYRDAACPVAQELFATTRDVYLVTGDLEERAADCDTADGRPATVQAAVVRLARTICADPGDFEFSDAQRVAMHVARAQESLLQAAWKQVLAIQDSAPASVVVSGHGDFLARRLLAWAAPSARVVNLSEFLGADQARAATAHAVAVLARERATGSEIGTPAAGSLRHA